MSIAPAHVSNVQKRKAKSHLSYLSLAGNQEAVNFKKYKSFQAVWQNWKMAENEEVNNKKPCVATNKWWQSAEQ